MYIKSIVLDGFKSYGNRVEITGFDPEFNAITGLNGTGKSNILDSICFVLGITNLSNVRAGSLQELIYKHGQAGITKATVSITFDNRDKKQCPIGYENHDEITVTRQVVMGGKNKYLINGINVQNKRVSDLFCSVQLNVNNPHFLIMQGRITKVLNMKPPEILSMVEEAAGTRMYEAKKQAAQKTIEKKDAKLRELNDIIREDIAPKLQKLQDERAQFQEYQKVVRELENLTRLHVAWRYVTAEENAKEAERKVTEVQDDIASKKESIKSNEREALELEGRAAELTRRLEQESGAAMAALQDELAARERDDAAAGAARRAAADALAAHASAAAAARRALRADDAALRERRGALQRARDACAGLRDAQQARAAALADAQRRFLAVSSGLEGDADSLQDRLIAAKRAASEASTRISQGAMEREHAEARLAALEREFASSGAQFRRDRETVDRQRAQVDELRAELDRTSADEGRSAELEARARGLAAEARRARDRRDGLAARLQRCDFVYVDPAPDFDRGRVHGAICKLIDVCDPAYCTALETAAGGRLFNVVVDSAATSQLLLQRGQLRVRTTLVPLDRIRAPAADARAEAAAREAGGPEGDARPALGLVRCAARVRPAVAWALGGAFAARSLDAARRVAFHPGVRRRCVTLDGDAFDPAGTLSGGARASAASVLLQLRELARAEAELRAAEAELAGLAAELTPLRAALEARADAQRRFELMSHELEVVRARLATTAHAQLHAEIETLRAQVAELTAAVERDKVTQKETATQARELEAKVKDIKGHREREFKKAEADLKKAKQDAEKHGDSWQQRSQELEALQLEVGELEAAVASAGRQLQEAEASAAELEAAAKATADDHAAATAAAKEVQLRIKRLKAETASKNGDIARLTRERERLAERNGELQLSVKELEFGARELRERAAEGQRALAALRREHAWLGAEREFFGAPGGLYDFAGRGAEAAGQRVAQLRARKERLARGLNARAHALLGREEEQFADVVRKRRIVEADRAKLVQVMAELDDKKRAALVGACAQVTRDFGAIFGCLLPGAQARLAPAGASVLDGLEVQVGFNGAWKESLGELSGGQRSLVALSLVLAMLRFKPAPLYVLDEVDAALDLAHTQNIGHMLRDHFRHSQFLIVSLKDGMFNNANVLFRTRFADGMSSVQRTVNARR